MTGRKATRVETIVTVAACFGQVGRERPAGYSAKSRSKFPLKIFRRAGSSTPSSSSTVRWTPWTAWRQPRGKYDESVPKSKRSGPRTASERR